jgi:hypothetical protein
MDTGVVNAQFVDFSSGLHNSSGGYRLTNVFNNALSALYPRMQPKVSFKHDFIMLSTFVGFACSLNADLDRRKF